MSGRNCALLLTSTKWVLVGDGNGAVLIRKHLAALLWPWKIGIRRTHPGIEESFSINLKRSNLPPNLSTDVLRCKGCWLSGVSDSLCELVPGVAAMARRCCRELSPRPRLTSLARMAPPQLHQVRKQVSTVMKEHNPPSSAMGSVFEV
jgi:hypothetical protein